MTVERRHERSATAATTHLGSTPTRGASGGVGAGAILRAADRRPGGEAQQELHQLFQAALLRSPLAQATSSDSGLGQETGRAPRPSTPGPPTRAPRTPPPRYRLQAAPMPVVPPGVARR